MWTSASLGRNAVLGWQELFDIMRKTSSAFLPRVQWEDGYHFNVLSPWDTFISIIFKKCILPFLCLSLDCFYAFIWGFTSISRIGDNHGVALMMQKQNFTWKGTSRNKDLNLLLSCREADNQGGRTARWLIHLLHNKRLQIKQCAGISIISPVASRLISTALLTMYWGKDTKALAMVNQAHCYWEEHELDYTVGCFCTFHNDVFVAKQSCRGKMLPVT